MKLKPGLLIRVKTSMWPRTRSLPHIQEFLLESAKNGTVNCCGSHCNAALLKALANYPLIDCDYDEDSGQRYLYFDVTEDQARELAYMRDPIVARVLTAASMSASVEKRAAGALLYCDGKFLVGKRGPDSDHAGTWANFGGGVDGNESIIDAIKREFAEETGYHGYMKLIPLAKFTRPNFAYYNFGGLVDQQFVPNLNHEHTDYKWCTLRELMGLNLLPAFREALMKPSFQKFLNSVVA